MRWGSIAIPYNARYIVNFPGGFRSYRSPVVRIKGIDANINRSRHDVKHCSKPYVGSRITRGQRRCGGVGAATASTTSERLRIILGEFLPASRQHQTEEQDGEGIDHFKTRVQCLHVPSQTGKCSRIVRK